MEDCCVHHVEFGVRNGDEHVRKFIQHYKFAVAAKRITDRLKQWVLKSGSATVLVTQPSSKETHLLNDQYCVGWASDNGNNAGDAVATDVDSVFNVALKVKNLTQIVDKLSRSGVAILKPVRTVGDNHGSVSFAVVRSCVGNVAHTLIDDSKYTGVFLPDFETDSDYSGDVPGMLVTHFDHVTFACNCGDSKTVLDWYSKCFGMRRFLINSQEDDESGFVIDTEDIGLRLKAFEYWKCAETGLSSGPHPESIKFVIAEALPNQGPNQVDTFLHDHHGPGIQHIGLHTDDIISTIATLNDNGVEFSEPPYTYYTEVGKYEEICKLGHDVEVLRKNGILVDAEADPGVFTQDKQPTETRYLMQKFTKPLFDRNTFFLEIIQRVGARGFGSGNITALWRSVQAYLNSKEAAS